MPPPSGALPLGHHHGALRRAPAREIPAPQVRRIHIAEQVQPPTHRRRCQLSADLLDREKFYREHALLPGDRLGVRPVMRSLPFSRE
jgi:hypothetical protein